MDEVTYLVMIDALAGAYSLENRIKQLLKSTTAFLNLDASALAIASDDGSNFQIFIDRVSVDNSAIYEKEIFQICSTRSIDPNKVVVSHSASVDFSTLDIKQETIADGIPMRVVAWIDLKPHLCLEVRLRLMRFRNQGEFNHNELKCIDRLISAVKSMITEEINAQLAALRLQSARKLSAYHQVGALVINHQRQVLDKSDLVDDMLNQSRCFSINENETLVGSTPDFQRLLNSALAELSQNPEIQNLTFDPIDRADTDCYTAVIIKNASLGKTMFYTSTFSILIFSWKDQCMELSRLLDNWKITPAEKKVLYASAEYGNIKKISSELNIW